MMQKQEEEIVVVTQVIAALQALAYRKAQDGRGHHGPNLIEDLVQGTEGDLRETRVGQTDKNQASVKSEKHCS